MAIDNSDQSDSEFLILENYSGRKGIDQFRRHIEEKIRPNLFSLNSKHELYYEALRHIIPINKSLENTSESIKAGINSILRHFKFSKIKASLSKSTENGLEKVATSTKKPLDLFETYLLGFNELPMHHLEELLPQVKADLVEINKLVIHYESLPVVQKFRLERRHAYNQEAKTILDFYDRGLTERQKILEYYLEGVYDRAIEKSKSSILPFNIPNFFKIWNDFPYETGKGILGQAIDYRNFDCVSHRIIDTPVSELTEARELYAESKIQFYRDLFKHTSPDSIFDKIFYNLRHIPANENRTLIFEELKRLFQHKSWLAFYAIALPQVEGLFAEMVSSDNPNSKNLTGGLPKKVNYIRPFYSMSADYFDYYEYELPNQRNKFSHTGYIDDIEVRAYDILTDLNHVLDVFASLENPFVDIVKKIRQKDELYFSDYFAIGTYFELRKKLHIGQLQKIRTEIDDFENNFLKLSCSLEYIFVEAIEELLSISEETWLLVSEALSVFIVSESYTGLNKPRLKKLMLNPDLAIKLEILLELNSDKFNALNNLQSFFEGVLSVLYPKDRPIEIQQNLKHWEKQKKLVKWLIDFEKIVLKDGVNSEVRQNN